MIAFPLAMTDGAARTILASGNQAIIDEAVPRLTSRDPERFWISGQWKTERSGGSDLRKAQTTAEPDGDGTWRLYGHKWFTSSIISNVALVLGRAEGAPEGYEGLALFYVPVRPDGDLVEGLRVDRLKDKLGARKLPCAELTLDGVRGVPLVGLSHGVQHIAPMLTITRTWTSLASCGIMRRGLALVRDFSQKRTAFGQPIIEKPLHYDTLANLQATFEGAFHLTFRLVELIGQDEAGRLSDDERLLLRLLSPMVKLTTAKQAVSVASEIVELFGGAGYVEDTGIPKLIRDAQVLPIWEGTTNVMALIMLRLMKQIGNLDPLRREFDRCAEAVESDSMRHVMSTARAAFDSALGWLSHAIEEGPAAVEAGARRFALTLGHALELALMARHAQWAMHHEDSRAAIAAERLATQGIDFITPRYSFDAYTLAKDVAKQSLFDTGSHQTP
jgi:alkylation response protein AidB-like acyl-CoA dehydrogenase